MKPQPAPQPQPTPTNGPPTPCRTCQEFTLAEAVANGERDWSRATDCRVLRKRHQEAGECLGREAG
ncbi:hypothetical protein ABZ114_14930 [Streptomyces albidoflavus]|uniref:hypothetical protein n=1 Tax=Streptomyces TaxID=1883 RepID=UPI00063E9E9C|nr:hypothetical protein [Streptomyces sp. KE1]KLJ01208.1 hypothetical protein WQ59_13955 [Streptomyces sp. KE1]